MGTSVDDLLVSHGSGSILLDSSALLAHNGESAGNRHFFWPGVAPGSSFVMNQALESLTQAALLFAAIFALTALGVAIARKLRDSRADDMSQNNELMTKFRDLHDEGGLSDEEFRTIKSKLATKLKTELKDNGNTG